jgi:hypothetical protein
VGEYRLDIKDGALMLNTASFRAEEGSVLHSGIYNRELTSSLAAGALTLAVVIALFFSGLAMTALCPALAVLAFVTSFVLFRVFVFYDSHLRAVIDRSKGTVTVVTKKMFGRESSYPLDALEDVITGRVVFTPENPDGIEVVEKIALQHGTVIPGFGETKELHTVEFMFEDGRKVMVFSSREPAEAGALAGEIRSFLGVQGA